MTDVKRYVRSLLSLIVLPITVFAGAFSASATVRRTLEEPAPTIAAVDAPAPDSLQRISQYFGGSVSLPYHDLVREHGNAPLLVVALRATDVHTCEDLGLQLRELQRSAVARYGMLILTDSSAEAAIRRFARQERLADIHIVVVTALVDVVDVPDGPPLTPFVMLVAPSGQIIRGVAHPVRIATVRPYSFAQEMSIVTPVAATPTAANPR